MFLRKKEQDNSKLLDEYKILNVKVAAIVEQFELMKQQIVSLRGLVNRKLNYTDEQTDKSKYDDGFDMFRV